jgi:mono/diheme cytochrome c family protein
LLRTLHEGISGTAMPSFKLMPEIDREALVEYVHYLSMRGEMELELASAAHESKDAPLKDDHDSLVEILDPIASSWQKPTDVAVIDRPADMQFDKIEDPAKRKAARDLSIALGREMFTHEKEGEFPYQPPDGSPPIKIKYQGAACIKCHGPTGLGDGQASDYDDWTKFAYDPTKWPYWNSERWGEKPTKQGELVPEWLVMPLGALPDRNIVPRNLRLGVYRGGRRPLDIYYRLHEGIKGTPMPQIAILYLPSEIEEFKKAAAADFAKSNPEPTKKDGESDSDFDKRRKAWEGQQTAQVNKKVDAVKQDWQNRRTWNVIDYVLSLPYEPGGELGADADITDVGHGELHAR